MKTTPATNTTKPRVANGRIYHRIPVARKLAARTEPGPNGCILWTGRKTRHGYGRVDVGGRREHGGGARPAHRVAYELARGPIPSGLVLDHLCKTPACINPDHLEPVTQAENNARGESYTARKTAQTHCLKGHPLSGTNLRITPRGRRDCRECNRNECRRRRERASR